MLQEFVESIRETVEDFIDNIHTTLPGKIISFDADTGLATVLPVMNFTDAEGNSIPYPQITGVPVWFPQSFGQEATIAFPVKPNDGCLIFVAEHSIDAWLYGQETDTSLSFDLTDAFCVPGLFAKANPVVKKACSENAIVIDVKGSEILVKKNKVSISADKIEITGELSVNGKQIG